MATGGSRRRRGLSWLRGRPRANVDVDEAARGRGSGGRLASDKTPGRPRRSSPPRTRQPGRPLGTTAMVRRLGFVFGVRPQRDVAPRRGDAEGAGGRNGTAAPQAAGESSRRPQSLLGPPAQGREGIERHPRMRTRDGRGDQPRALRGRPRGYVAKDKRRGGRNTATDWSWRPVPRADGRRAQGYVTADERRGGRSAAQRRRQGSGMAVIGASCGQPQGYIWHVSPQTSSGEATPRDNGSNCCPALIAARMAAGACRLGGAAGRRGAAAAIVAPHRWPPGYVARPQRLLRTNGWEGEGKRGLPPG